MSADSPVAMLVHRQTAVAKVLRGQLAAWGYTVVDKPSESGPPALKLGLVEASAADELEAFAKAFPGIPLVAVASLRKPFDIFDAVRRGAWTCVVLQDIHAVRDAVGTNRPKPGEVDPLWQTLERVLAEDGAPRPAAISSSGMEEHLATVRALTKGVGDRINNPLTVVKAAVSSVRDAIGDTKTTAADTELAKELAGAMDSAEPALDRIHELSLGMRAFAMPANASLGNVDILRVLRDVAPDSEVTGPDAVRVFANEKALREALTAVVANARESYPAGVTNLPVSITVTVAPPSLHIAIADRGTGMTDAVRQRAFEPFFTHAKSQGALGLGLTLARDRIVSMRGEITLSSTDGGGTTVHVRLPIGV